MALQRRIFVTIALLFLVGLMRFYFYHSNEVNQKKTERSGRNEVQPKKNERSGQDPLKINTAKLHTTEESSSKQSPDKLPNIVYMLADDLGYGDVGYNGGPALTPNIDAMANGIHSIQFNRFYSGGPTCTPARGTLLTGRNHNRYCLWHADLGNSRVDLTCPSLMPLPSSELTIAEILSSVGYHTWINGKWHLGDLKRLKGGNKKWPISNPGTNGFHEWLVTERILSNVLPNCKCFPEFECSIDGEKYSIPKCWNYWYMNPLTNQLTKSTTQVFEDSHFIVDKFEEFLRNRNTSKPFFAELSFHSVHSLFLATPFWKQYYKSRFTNSHRIDYLGATSSLDEAVGRVRELLKQFNISENTLVWFSSDNGPEKGEPGLTGGLRGRKGTLWEGGIRVPGIIEWPAVIHKNRKSSIPVSTTDFLPTVVDILGYRMPQDHILDGISLVPILKNVTKSRGSNMKFAFQIRKGNLNTEFYAAVVGDRYKYHAIFNHGKEQEFWLFDLETDRAETTNVSSSHVDLTLSMREEFKKFLLSVNESATQTGCLMTHDRRYVQCH